MNEVPGNVTTERAKPRLIILDDDSVLLQRFTAQYRRHGYEVIPVLVADGNNDTLFVDGRIRQGAAELPQAEEPTAQDPQRTVADELREAQRQVKADPLKHRFATDLAIYTAMQEFTYGVKSKHELRALLSELKPDCVLSDMQMRRPADPDASEEHQRADPDCIMGDHVMAMAKEILPNAARAIHTGQYTLSEDMIQNWDAHQIEDMRSRYQTLCAEANAQAQPHGYRVFAKDQKGHATTLNQVDAYFKKALGNSLEQGWVVGG